MVRMTEYQMSYLLDIDLQKTKSPLLRWVEDKLSTGQGTDYGSNFSEVLDFVSIKVFDTEPLLLYDVENGLLQVSLQSHMGNFISDKRKPTQSELCALLMTHPEERTYLERKCRHLKICLDKPHSCKIEYHIQSAWCVCKKVGLVNYRSSKDDWEYWCGGSDRCCP